MLEYMHMQCMRRVLVDVCVRACMDKIGRVQYQLMFVQRQMNYWSVLYAHKLITRYSRAHTHAHVRTHAHTQVHTRTHTHTFNEQIYTYNTNLERESMDKL